MNSVAFTPVTLPSRLVQLGWESEVRVRGQLANPERSVAIVGARAATYTAVGRAHAIAKHLARHGVHVVSGGAIGVDGAAHRGAIDGGGTTTVVLGTGVDVLYPARHVSLFHEVLGSGGALVSMFPDASGPRRHTFTKRNALIAALADVVLVIEADLRSGSLSTASAAHRYGRTVAAWPGSEGCDRLLAQGAALVECEGDALAAAMGTPRVRPPVPLDPVATAVRAAIDAGCVTIDDIVRTTGLAVRAVLRALPLIEMTSARKL
ncbi:MAG: DNA-processing protein DprA [Kofleriaceae bacterium]